MKHRELHLGRWRQMSLMEQLANVGSEISRTYNWMQKKNDNYAQNAFERALELLDLTIHISPRYAVTKELCRAREEICKHFTNSDIYEIEKLNRYFLPYAVAARRNL